MRELGVHRPIVQSFFFFVRMILQHGRQWVAEIMVFFADALSSSPFPQFLVRQALFFVARKTQFWLYFFACCLFYAPCGCPSCMLVLVLELVSCHLRQCPLDSHCKFLSITLALVGLHVRCLRSAEALCVADFHLGIKSPGRCAVSASHFVWRPTI